MSIGSGDSPSFKALNSEPCDRQAAQEELARLRAALAEQTSKAAYFERQTEQMAARLLKADANGSALRHELEQKRRGFSLLAALSAALTPTSQPQEIFQATSWQINATLNMERTVVLTPGRGGVLSVTLTHGYDHDTAEALLGQRIDLPNGWMYGEGGLLITKESGREMLLSVRQALALPFFIAVPVIHDADLLAVIVTGRTREQKPFMPRLGEGDRESLQAIAAFLASVFARGHILEVERVNQRLRLENERISMAKEQAEGLARAKSEFVAVVSHEVRTPMNGVLGLSRLLLDSPLNADQRELAETIVSSGETLLGILNEILDLSKLEAGRIALETVPFLIVPLIEESLALFATQAAEKGLALSCRIAPEVPSVVVGDALRLRQVLLNLIGNAVKFTDQGTVIVTVDVLRLENADQTTHVPLVIAVADTGIGIALEAQGRLFTRYEQADVWTTRRYGGTGLGLSISKQLIELMDGAISVFSAPGQGATFSAVVRVGLAPMDVPGMPRERAVLRDRPKVVVIADSCGQTRTILRQRFSDWGCSVIDVDGVSAIEDCGPVMAGGGLVVLSHRLGDQAIQTLLDAAQPHGGVVRAIVIGQGNGARPQPDPRGFMVLQEPVRELALVQAWDWLALDPALRCHDLSSDGRSWDGVGGHEPPTTPASPSLPPLTVLLAEDNAINRRVAVGLLERQGVKVVAVSDGEQALDVLKRTPFDLVLMDRNMPGMDGIETVRAMRQLSGPVGKIPVIALTAAATVDDAQECLDAGMNAFVPKPVDPEQLYQVILSVIGQALPESRPVKVAPSVLSLPGVKAPAYDGSVILALFRDLGEDTVSQLVGDFDQSATRLLQAVDRACDQRDLSALEYSAHSFKSAAGFLGMLALRQHCIEVERLAKTGHVDAFSVAADLRTLSSEARCWLEAICAATKA